MKCNCGYTANGSRSEIETKIVRDGGMVRLENNVIIATCPECKEEMKLEK